MKQLKKAAEILIEAHGELEGLELADETSEQERLILRKIQSDITFYYISVIKGIMSDKSGDINKYIEKEIL